VEVSDGAAYGAACGGMEMASLLKLFSSRLEWWKDSSAEMTDQAIAYQTDRHTAVGHTIINGGSGSATFNRRIRTSDHSEVVEQSPYSGVSSEQDRNLLL
jgi:hypothetical protein